ncbi:MFS transporter [Streptomyces sp. NPDC006530]|uniref:MFS transporter n=1 Tax=Streptomyces sp. NPDC006530 TaxID=3364750 RepID=UPI0036C45386
MDEGRRTAAAPTPGRRNLVAATVGNALEWYDWNVYALMAPFFATRFFVAGSATTALLSSLAVFAVGFVARPVGGLVMGVISDRRGRRTAMLWSIALMAAGSLLIGLTPAHDAIGVLSPLLLVFARLVQGLSAGGEFAASAAYLVESAPDRRKGLYSSFLYTGNLVGTLLATGLGALLALVLDHDAMTAWGWRLPFLVGGVAAVLLGLMRRQMEETLPPSVRRDTAGEGILAPLRRNAPAAMVLCGITAGATVAYYTWIVALPGHAVAGGQLGPGQALLAATIAQALLLAALPFVGMLADRVGPRRLILAFSGGLALLCVPLYSLAQGSFTGLLTAEVIGLLLFSGYGATAALVMVELFPLGARGIGVGLPYAATVAAFGGTAPYVSVWMDGHGPEAAFPVYVALLCVLTFAVAWRKLDRGRGSAAPDPAPHAERLSMP